MADRVVYSDGNRPPENGGTMCTAEEGKTRQSDATSSDINLIVKKYETTGILPVPQRAGVFMDISSVPTFQEALATLDRADKYFMSLPPHVRAAFGNSAAKMVDAFNANEERELFEEIGILEPVPPVPEAAPAVVAP